MDAQFVVELERGSGADMFISSVSPKGRFCHFWAQTDYAHTEKLESLTNNIREDLDQSIPNHSIDDIHLGKCYWAKFLEDDQWYRGQVIEKSHNAADKSVTVYFIDYGNTEIISIENIREGAQSHFSLSPLAVECVLADIQPLTDDLWSEREEGYLIDKLCYGEFSGDVLSDATLGRPAAVRVFDALGSTTRIVSSFINDNCGREYRNDHLNLSKIPEVRIFPGSKHEVQMSYVESPSMFYLQFTSSEEQLDTLSLDLNNFYKSRTLTDSSPLANVSVGDICATTFAGEFYRSRITDIKLESGTKNAEVVFIDYGNTEIKTTDELRTLPPELCELPPQAVQCGLFDEGVCSYEFETLVDSGPFLARVISVLPKGRCIVELNDKSTGKVYGHRDGVNEPTSPIVNPPKGIAKSSTPANKPLKKAELIPELPQYEEYLDVCISHVNSDGSFYCQLIKNAPALDTLMADMQFCYNETSKSEERNDVPCVIKSATDGAWYRTSSTSTVEAQLVDFGDKQQFYHKKQIKPKHLELPIQALHCQLANVNENFQTALKKYESKVGLIAKFEKVTSGPYLVTLYDTTSMKDICLNEKLYEEVSKINVPISPRAAETINAAPNRNSKIQTPRMPRTTLQRKTVPLPQIQIGSTENVFVFAAEKPPMFFGQLAKFSMEELDIFQGKLYDFYETSGDVTDMYLESVPIAGDVCCAKSSEDEGWYRAQVTSFKGGEVELQYLDYGNTEKKPPQDLRVLEDEYTTLPQQGINCIIEKAWSMTPKQFELMLLEKSVAVKILGKRGNAFLVDFADHPDNTQIRNQLDMHVQELQQKQAASAVSPRSINNVRTPPPVSPPARGVSNYLELEYVDPFLKKKTYEDVMVTYSQEPDHFWCQLLSSENELNDLMDKIHYHCSALGPIEGLMDKFGLGLPCLALCTDQCWYRAKITGVLASGKVEVNYVDYGNCEVISKEDVKRTMPEFMQLPIQAVQCALSDVACYEDYWPADHVAQFERESLEKTYIALLESYDEVEDLWQVELFEPPNHSTTLNDRFGRATKSLSQRRGRPAAPPKDRSRTQPPPASMAMARLMAQQVSAESGGGGPADLGPVSVPQTGAATTGQLPSQQAFNTRGFTPPGIHTSGPPQAPPNKGTGDFRPTQKTGQFDKSWSEPSKEPAGEVRSIKREPSPSGASGEPQSAARPQSQPKTAPVKYTPLELEINKYVDLFVVYSLNPDQFWCQLAKNLEQLEQMMERLHTIYSRIATGQLGLTSALVGTACVAKFEEDGVWYRAEILKINGDEVLVKFVDYGNTQSCAVSDLKEAKQEFIHLPAQAIQCALHNVQSAGKCWTGEDKDAFDGLVMDKNLVGEVVSKREDGVYTVELVGPADTETGDMVINKELIRNGNARPITATPPSSVKSYRSRSTSSTPSSTPVRELVRNASQSKLDAANAYKLLTISNGQTFDVALSWINTPKDFWIQILDNGPELDDMMNKLHEFYSSLPADKDLLPDPDFGKACVALYHEDESWYRARIVGLNSGVAEVLFVDYGNAEKVPLNLIKKVKQEFLQLPAQAVQCQLKGVAPIGSSWTGAEKDILEDMVGDECKCTFLASYNKMFLVDLESQDKSVAFELNKAGVVRLTNKASSCSTISLASSSSHASKSTLQQRFVESIFDLALGKRENFLVTYVTGPHQFCCQLTSNESQLNEMMDSLENHYSSLDESASQLNEPKTGETCAAKYTQDEMWYRGLITDVISATSVEVLFVDYGNSEVLPLSSVKVLIPDFVKLPMQGLQCALSGIPPVVPKVAVKRFKDLATDKELSGLVKELFPGSKIGLEMTDRSNGKSVKLNQEVALSIFAEDSTAVDGDMSATSCKSSTVSTTSSSKSPMLRSPSKAQLPNLPSFAPKPSGLPLLQIQENQSMTTYLSAVESPGKFYIHLADKETELETMADKLQDVYSTFEVSDHCLMATLPGQVCCAKYSVDSAWYRARIISSEGSAVKVLFIDYGNVEDCDADSLKQLISEFQTTPPLAAECRLQGCGASSEDLTAKFEALLLDQEIDTEFISTSPPYQVKLKVEGKDVASEIGLSVDGKSPVQSNSNESQDDPEELPNQELPNGCVPGYVSHIDSPGKFYVQLVSQELALDETTEGITAIYSELESSDLLLLTPSIGKICCAKFPEDGAWYRALVTGLSGKGTSVLFVDFGNSSIVPAENMKELAPQFMDKAPFAYECSLGKIPNCAWPEEILDAFTNATIDQVDITFKSKSAPHIVSLSSEGEDIAESIGASSFQDVPLLPQKQAPSSAESLGAGPQNYPKVIPPKGEFQAFIGQADSPSRFFVMPSTSEATLFELAECMYATYANSSPANQKLASPKVGQPCVAMFSEDSTWYRGEVIALNGNSAQVRFVDFGNGEEMATGLLRRPTPELLKVAPVALECSLAGISAPAGGWNDQVCRKLKQLTEDRELTVSVQSNDVPFKVSLRDGQTTISADSLGISPIPAGQDHGAKPQASHQEQPCSGETPTVTSNLVNGDDYHFLPPDEVTGQVEAYASHIISPSRFYLQLSAKEDELNEVVESVNSTYSAVPEGEGRVATPSIGQACCAKFSEDEAWYRAEITQLHDDRATVLFIDFGNSDDTAADRLLTLKPEHLEQPPFAYECALVGAKESEGGWPQDICDKLSELIVDKDLTVEFLTQKAPFQVRIKESGVDIGKEFGFKELLDESPAIEETEKAEDQPEKSASEAVAVNECVCSFPKSRIDEETASVYISHIDSPTKFHIQLSSMEAELSQVGEDLEAYCASVASSEGESWAAGKICCAKFSEDGAWYRGIITDVKDLQYEVFFVDYGNSDHISDLDSLKSISPELANRLPLAFECKLKGLTEPLDGWSESLVDKFSEVTLDKPLEAVFYTKDSPYEVSLADGETAITVLLELPPAIKLEPSEPEAAEDTLKATDLEGDQSLLIIEPVEEPPVVIVVDEESEVSMVEENEEPAKLVDANEETNVQVEEKEVDTFQQVDVETSPEVEQRDEDNDIPDKEICLERSFSSYLKYPDVEPPHGEVKVHVSHVESPTQISLQLVDNQEKLAEIMSSLEQNYAENPDSATVMLECKDNIPCAAKYSEDQTWYRGFIQDSEDGMLVVRFIDYGNTETLTLENVRFLDKSLASSPPFALECTLGDCEEPTTGWSFEVVDQLESLLLEKELSAEFLSVKSPYKIKLKDDEHIVTLKDVGIEALESVVIETCDPMILVPDQGESSEHNIESVNDSPDTSTNPDGEISGPVADILDSLVHEIVSAKKPSETESSEGGKECDTGIQSEEATEPTGELISEPETRTEDLQQPIVEETTALPIKGEEEPVEENPATEASSVSNGYPEVPVPSTATKVLISHVDHPSKFYVQQVDHSERLDQLTTDIEAHYKEETPVTTPAPDSFQPGQPCCVQTSPQSAWYRATVMGTNDYGVAVQFVDVGNILTVPVEQVRTISVEHKAVPPHAVECTLVDVSQPEEGWTDVQKERFTQFVMNKELTAEFLTGSTPIPIRLKHLDGDVTAETLGLQAGLQIPEGLQDSLQGGHVETFTSGDSVTCVDTTENSPHHIEPTEPDDIPLLPRGYLQVPLKVGTKEEIYMCHCVSPSQFWIQLKKYETGLSLMTEGLQEHFSSLESAGEPGVSPVELGLCCAARSVQDNNWYRARVTKLEGEQCEVFYVDYGNTELLPASRVRKSTTRFMLLPAQAVECTLSGVRAQGTSWSADVATRFLELTSGKCLLADIRNVSNDNTFMVRLLDMGLSVAEKLISAGLAVDVTQPIYIPRTHPIEQATTGGSPERKQEEHAKDEEKAPTKIRFQSPDLEAGMVIEVYVTSSQNPHNFWCQLASSSTELPLLMDTVQDHYRKLGEQEYCLEQLAIGTPCVAQYSQDQVWYRSLIQKVQANSDVEVVFVDYGNTEVLSPSKVKQINKDLTLLPAQAFRCRLDNVLPLGCDWEVVTCERFEELTYEKPLQAEIISTHRGTDEDQTLMVVSLKDGESLINQSLVDGGYAKTDNHASISTDSQKKAEEPEIPEPNGAGAISLAPEAQASVVQSADTGADLSPPRELVIAETTAETLEIATTDSHHCVVAPPSGKELIPCGDKSLTSIEITNTTQVINQPPVNSDASTAQSGASKKEDIDSTSSNKTTSPTTELKESSSLEDIGAIAETLVNQVLAKSIALFSTETEMKERNDRTSPPVSVFKPAEFELGQAVPMTYISGGSPYDFVCQTSSSAGELQSLMDRIAVHCSKELEPLSVVKMSSGCLARYSEDHVWYRAEVKAMHGKKYLVFFVDNGNSEVVEKDDLCHIPLEFLELPRQALCCMLDGLQIQPCTEEIQKIFEGLCNEKKLLGKVVGKNAEDVHKVYLYDTEEEGNSLNSLLATRGHVSIQPGSELEQEAQFQSTTSFSDTECEAENSFHEVSERRRSSLGEDPGPETSNQEEKVAPSYTWSQFEVGQELKLHYVEAQDPDNLTCQVMETHSQLQELGQKLTSFYNTQAVSEGNIFEAGQPCCAKYTQDDCWYRAQILTVTEDSVSVYFVDFGNMETLSKDRVRPLLPEFCSLSPQVIHCSVADIKPICDTWIEGISESLSRVCSVESAGPLTASVISVDDDTKIVANIITSEGIDLKQWLIEQGLALSQDAESNESSVRSDSSVEKKEDVLTEDEISDGQLLPPGGTTEGAAVEYKRYDFDKGTDYNVQVSHVISPNNFWCQLIDAELPQLMEQVQVSCKDSKPFAQLEEGCACCARVSDDALWYRAQVLSCYEGVITVLFVDYGNTMTVSLEHTCPLSPELAQDPPGAIQCSLYNLQPTGVDWANEAVEVMESLEYMTVKMNVMQHCDQGTLGIQLVMTESNKNVADKLISMGYAKHEKIERPELEVHAVNGEPLSPPSQSTTLIRSED